MEQPAEKENFADKVKVAGYPTPFRSSDHPQGLTNFVSLWINIWPQVSEY